MRVTIVASLVMALTVSTTAQQHQHDPDKQIKGTGKMPAGWRARLDDPAAKLEAVIVKGEKNALTFTTGPAGIYYKPSTKESGNYDVTGTFSQIKPSVHPEAYGLFIGGTDLDRDTQRYTYFLIRQDGKYLIKSRDGATTKPIVDWASAAPMKDANVAKAGFKTSNELAIHVRGDKVSFLIGGTQVHELPRAQVTSDGIAGIRINHNLEVQVTGFDVKKAG
jgi:hypothetical protein